MARLNQTKACWLSRENNNGKLFCRSVNLLPNTSNLLKSVKLELLFITNIIIIIIITIIIIIIIINSTIFI